jgi:short-subunit dehydrogenase
MDSKPAPCAVITGASAGIGEAIAQELHRRGYNIHVVARRGERLAELCRQCNQHRPDSASMMVLDLAKSEECRHLEIFLETHPIDLLVNNVGRGSYQNFELINRDLETEMVILNTIVPLRLAHAVIPSMKERAKNVNNTGIIFLSSIAGFQPLPFMSTYAATKSFNLSQSLSLREELRPFGVHVTAVCPGPVATEFGKVAGAPMGDMKLNSDSADFIAKTAIDGFEKNVSVVVPGIKAKLMVLASMIVPTFISTRLVRMMIEPRK